MSVTVAAPSATRSRWQRMAAPTAAVSGLAATTVALHYRDPHVAGSWGFCPSALLGIYCPGCGGLRAVHDLTNADLAAATSSNLLFVCAIPLIVLLLGRWVLAAWRGTTTGQSWSASTPVLYAGLAVALAFTVARNLPGSWLAP